ncbi:DUF1573 domain-containing protein [Gimesia chilikensis]|uniref:DUF1573 domain-containing protein n=1 Tax=Gimesia chilikensis TaxID=2605989 RepID=A0A517WE32_9PLAN|nr:DUF1573 domain-containing protein [Gimesia chilikensis]QDT21376.1 hypothetical protein HG66A1_31760 [Gimesia chilikensis]QDU03520.1 hypothetical protein V6x_32400 [Gimesia chilikensis]
MLNRILQSKWTRRSLLTLATLPFVLSSIAYWNGSTVQKSMAGAPRPALAFETFLVDRGMIKETERVVGARFRFKNLSDQTVTVKELIPSCGCLQPHLEKRVYEPHESGEFILKMETAGESPGQKELFVDFKYEDTMERVARLTFKVELPIRRLVVKPKALVIYQFTPGRTVHPVTVSDYRGGKDFEITSVKSTSKYAKVELGALENNDGLRQQKVDVIVEDLVPPGKHDGLVVIKTNDTDFPELYVPLIIQGPDQKTVLRPEVASPQAN